MRATTLLAMAVAFVAAGCATGTRSGTLGPLGPDATLVSLIVSEDVAVVRRECPFAVAIGSILGCQMSKAVALPRGGVVHTVRIVRYTDRLPSPLTFEVDLHELCHAIATVQGIVDPCHVDNGGVAEHSSAAPRALFGR